MCRGLGGEFWHVSKDNLCRYERDCKMEFDEGEEAMVKTAVATPKKRGEKKEVRGPGSGIS